MHSEGFEQTTRSRIHGAQDYCDSNLLPFGGFVENTYPLRHATYVYVNILYTFKKHEYVLFKLIIKREV